MAQQRLARELIEEHGHEIGETTFLSPRLGDWAERFTAAREPAAPEAMDGPPRGPTGMGAGQGWNENLITSRELLDGMITDKKYIEYMKGLIKDICDTCGPRIATTPEDAKGNLMIKEECETFADEIVFDAFKCAKNAYPGGLVRVAAGLLTFGFFFMFTHFYILTIVLGLLALLVVVMELMVFVEFIDPFYKKGTSHNVFGKVKPTGETKKILIFAGHSDSAYEIPFAKKFGARINKLMIGGLGFGFFTIVLAVLKTIFIATGILQPVNFQNDVIDLIFSITVIDLIFLGGLCTWGVFFYWVVKNVTTHNPVLGANDNLSGVAVALALGKYLQDRKPRNVEVWVGSFGAEETGQRGSRRFGAKYSEDPFMKEHSYTVVLESLSGMGFALMEGEGMRIPSVPYSEEANEMLWEAMETYKGEKRHGGTPPYLRTFAQFAGCDACSITRSGMKATALVSGNLDTFFIDNWHQTTDDPEHIDGKMLWHALNFCATLVDNLDKKLD